MANRSRSKSPAGRTRRLVKKSPNSDGRPNSAPAVAKGGDTTNSNRRDAMRVFLYAPNIIGYIRILCMFGFFRLARHGSTWKIAMVLYAISFVGDAIDGHVARYFGQTSSYGGMLDMLTDRMGTMGLLMAIAKLDDKHTDWCYGLICLDICSHWLHMHVAAMLKGHHKSAETLKGKNVFLKFYYSNFFFFAFCCIGTELFYVLLYVLHWAPRLAVPLPFFPISVSALCWYVAFPACCCKQYVNIAQYTSAAFKLALDDAANASKKKA